MILPSVIECKIENTLTTIKVCYSIIDSETGAMLSAYVYGQGMDQQDKGIYKAFTGAEKYFFLKTLLIPTYDDPENDKTPPPQKPNGEKTYTPSADRMEAEKEVKQRDEIWEWCVALGNGDITTARQILTENTEFIGRDGKTVAGVTDVSQLKSKRLQVAHKIIREVYNKMFGEDEASS